MSHEKYWAFFEKLDYSKLSITYCEKDEVLKLKQQIKQTNKNNKTNCNIKENVIRKKSGNSLLLHKR